MNLRNNKAQVTIFIILAILIVSVIVIAYIFYIRPSIDTSSQYDPEPYIDKCAKDATDQAVGRIMKQGGYINPTNFKLYDNEKIGYLCYNSNYYYPCINQEPMLIEHIEKEITSYIYPRIDGCFSSLKLELEKRGYSVNLGSMNITTQLKTKKVVLDIDRNIEITKGGDSRKISKFKSQLINPIYDLANMAFEIVNQEAQYCNAEYLGIMIFYPNFNIDKFVTGDDIKIYTIGDRISGERFKFAVRSCALPSGF